MSNHYTNDDLNTLFQIYKAENVILEEKLKNIVKQYRLSEQKQIFVSCMLGLLAENKNEGFIPLCDEITEEDCTKMFSKMVDLFHMNLEYISANRSSTGKSQYKVSWTTPSSIYKYLKHSQYKHVCFYI